MTIKSQCASKRLIILKTYFVNYVTVLTVDIGAKRGDPLVKLVDYVIMVNTLSKVTIKIINRLFYYLSQVNNYILVPIGELADGCSSSFSGTPTDFFALFMKSIHSSTNAYSMGHSPSAILTLFLPFLPSMWKFNFWCHISSPLFKLIIHFSRPLSPVDRFLYCSCRCFMSLQRWKEFQNNYLSHLSGVRKLLQSRVFLDCIALNITI